MAPRPVSRRGRREDATRWRSGLPGAGRPEWPVRGRAGNEIASALRTMMPKSTSRFNERPKTSMQDRTAARSPKPLAMHGKTMHSGRKLAYREPLANRAKMKRMDTDAIFAMASGALVLAPLWAGQWGVGILSRISGENARGKV